MFDDEEWVKVVDKLRQLTTEGKLEWELEEDGTLYVGIGNTSYTIEARDGDAAPPYDFHVRVSDREVGVLTFLSGPETDLRPGTKISPLREIAFRMAMGGPELANQLLADLNKIDPTEPPSYGAHSPF